MKFLKFKAYYIFQPTIMIIFIVLGFCAGYLFGIGQTIKISKAYEEELKAQYEKVLSEKQNVATIEKIEPTPSIVKTQAKLPSTSYTGPELWSAINKSRIEHGVEPLRQKDILCTIAAIRLNQQLELGKLDGHDGFRPTYDKYKDDLNMPNNVSEFLISGYPTPDQAVAGWLDTLGHKKLVTGGEYVWGCVYAQDSFGVAITGY